MGEEEVGEKDMEGRRIGGGTGVGGRRGIRKEEDGKEGCLGEEGGGGGGGGAIAVAAGGGRVVDEVEEEKLMSGEP